MKVKEMDDRAYHATCPNEECPWQGTSFVHDDLFQDDEDDAVCPECETPLVWDGAAKNYQALANAYHAVFDAKDKLPTRVGDPSISPTRRARRSPNSWSPSASPHPFASTGSAEYPGRTDLS